MHVGQSLHLIADFAIGGKIAGVVAVVEAERAGGFALGGEVFGFLSFVHQSRREERNLSSDSCISHILSRRGFKAR